MKKIYKYIQLQLTYLGNFINWLILFITQENFRCDIKTDKINKELRILGNGPSLNFEKVIRIDSNVEYCMVNQACLTPEFNKLKPSIYIIADPGYINPKDPDALLMWERFSKGLDWDMTIYVPYFMYKQVKSIINPNSRITLSFYHSASFQGWKNLSFLLYNKNVAIPGAGNVMAPSIYIGILKGYKTIRLYGTDHSWTEQLRVNKFNQVCVKQLHYYDDEDSIELVPWNDEIGKPFSMKRILNKFSEIFKQYEIIEQYAKSRNVKVINMCQESFIDAFEKQHE